MTLDWDKLVTLGVPTILLIGLYLWWTKQGWPFITKRIEKSDQEHKEIDLERLEVTKSILTTLDEMRKNLTSNTEVTLTVLGEIRRGKLDAEREQSRRTSPGRR